MQAPQVETDRLLLRGPLPEDAAVWAGYIDDPDFLRYLPRRSAPALQRAERLLASIAQAWEQDPPSDIVWVVTDKANGHLMGWAGAGPTGGTGDVELVYSYGKPFWGQGFATEAARAVVRYGFERVDWNEIVAAIVPGNTASQRVLEHVGFVYTRDVNYYEMAGDTSFQLDSPMVPYFVLRRDQFVRGTGFYRVHCDHTS